VYNDLINFFKLFFSKKKPLAIFCESLSYSCYFQELINELSKEKIDFIYICQSGDKNIKKFEINEYYSFNNTVLLALVICFINCKKLILTTPDYGNTMKVSKNCDELIYIFHSLVSTYYAYKERAFDAYDVICCAGPHHYREFKKKNKNIKKKLLRAGYPYLDTLIKNKNNYLVGKKILIAPTWNPEEANYYYINYFKLIDLLLRNNHKVILRPHPEFLKRFKPQIDILNNNFKHLKSFFLDVDHSNFHSMNESKLMITDWSGIALEYAFIYKKPILFLNTKQKLLNKKIISRNYSIIEKVVRKKIGLIIQLSQISNIEYYIKKLEKNKKIYYKNIEKCIKQYTYNFGHSAYEIVKYLKPKNLN
jgi:hypothetical protein